MFDNKDKVFKNVTVTISGSRDNKYRYSKEEVADALENIHEVDLRDGLRELANRSPRKVMKIAQMIHGRLYSLIRDNVENLG